MVGTGGVEAYEEIQMSKVGKSLLKGAEEALAYAKDNKKVAKAHMVRVPKHIDVRTIRDKLRIKR